MNYPIQSLTVIAPIVFILLMIIVPVIGVFAGWKRAAYWGGGTSFFFLIGVIIWKAAGPSITSGLVGLINNLLSGLGATATPKLVASLAAPLFFIIVMAITYLILVINYYAWFKRVAKIKQDIKLKKEMKAAKKAGKPMPKVQGSKWTQMQFTTTGKAINMACGGAGLALLLAPSTVTFTQAIMYTTTSVSTRANNKLCANLYASLEKTADAFSWMSYYGNADTGKDYNSLFSMLTLTNEKISYSYTDATGQTITVTNGTVAEAMVNIISGNLGNVVKQTTQAQDPVAAANTAIDGFAEQWNSLLASNEATISSVFQSENITDVLKSVLGEQVTKQQQLTDKQLEEGYLNEDSVFNIVYQQYLDRPESKQLTQIPVSQGSYNNIADSAIAVFDLSGVTEEHQTQFKEKVTEMIGLMFKVA